MTNLRGVINNNTLQVDHMLGARNKMHGMQAMHRSENKLIEATQLNNRAKHCIVG
jgi:hypothetical protein